MDLLSTVRERHSKTIAVAGHFTLIHRILIPATKEDPQKRNGILNFLGSRFTHISKKIQDDMAIILDRWSHAQEKTMSAQFSKETARQTSMWKEFASRTEKTRLEYTRSANKKMDLLLVETNKNIAALRRDTDRITQREADRKRELESTPRDFRPVSVKDARRLVESRVDESNDQLELAIKRSARKSIRDAVRRVHEEDEYARLRGGGRRKQ